MSLFPRRGLLLLSALVFSFLLLAIAGCGSEPSGEHSHAAETGAHADEHAHGAGIRVTRWTDATEVFAEHPVMTAGQRSDAWAVHVTRLDGFEPLEEGTLTLRFRRPDGAAYVHEANAPSGPGIFTPQPEIPQAGTFQLFAIVAGPGLRDTIDMGALTVHPAGETPDAPAQEEAEISFSKEQQWSIDFSTTEASQRPVQSSIVAPGDIQPVPGRFARVAAPVSGLTPANANLNMPAPGDRVRKGQTLAVLTPSGGESSYPDVKARVERLRREVERAERLYEVEAIPEKRLVDARHELEVARAALQSMGGAEGDGFEYTLRAPIGGHVQERHLVPGSRVEVGAPLYSIVDAQEVWIRVRVPAEHAAQLDEVAGGSFTVESGDERFQADRVVSVGATLDPDSRTIPVRLAVQNPDRKLKIGMLVQANLFVGDTETGTAIPNEAIQMEDGEPVAYVQTGGESFERRPLRLGMSDGSTTLVVDGVRTGEHVVTRGAYQVYLASLNTAEVGGHGHPH